jgi:hypothetical protein
MGVSLDPDKRAKIEGELAVVKMLISSLDATASALQAGAAMPMMLPNGMVVTLQPAFVQGLAQALKAQRDYGDRLIKLIEVMYNEMVDKPQ